MTPRPQINPDDTGDADAWASMPRKLQLIHVECWTQLSSSQFEALKAGGEDRQLTIDRAVRAALKNLTPAGVIYAAGFLLAEIVGERLEQLEPPAEAQPDVAVMSLEQLELLELELLAEADRHDDDDVAFWNRLDRVAIAAADERIRRRAIDGGGAS